MTGIHSNLEQYDRVIIGAGIFGLYAALRFARDGHRVLIVEKAEKPFGGASTINQARIHRGYHYPRSLSTALRTAQYVERFATEFPFAVNRTLRQIYAIAKNFSYTNAQEYEKFCRHAGIPYTNIDVSTFLNPVHIEAAYMTEEYGYDAEKMCTHLLDELAHHKGVTFFYNAQVTHVEKDDIGFSCTIVRESHTTIVQAPYVVNATYAGLNEVIRVFGYTPLAIKYEFAELALCTVPPELTDVGLTVMDGPFFSLMPFGFTGLHTLSAVSYTPNRTSAEEIDTAAFLPASHFGEMKQLAEKYLKPNLTMQYKRSLYTTKAILTKTESDDARPTLIQVHSETPRFVSVLSGKLNTIFDLDTAL